MPGTGNQVPVFLKRLLILLSTVMLQDNKSSEKIMGKYILSNIIDKVNSLYAAGENDDDAVKSMVHIDKKTKGYSFLPQYDSYIICTDEDKLLRISNKYGYYSKQVESFNCILTEKGGGIYMQTLNNNALAKIKEQS